MNMEMRPQNEAKTTASLPDAPLRDGSAIEAWLISKLASRLSMDPDRIDRGAPILHLGLDSVDAMEILGDVEETCRVTLDADPSVRDIARRIHSLMGNVHVPVPVPVPVSVSAHPRPEAPRAKGRSAPGSEAPTTGPRHPYAEYVNPFLADRLARLDLDKRFVRGEGCYLEDAAGRRYLDFVAQYGALPFGFNPPDIWEAMAAVRSNGEPSFVQPSALEAAGELARRLVEAAPKDLALVTFSNSGAEAIEAAIKLCRAATGRMGILTTTGSFHGKTLGALSATGNPSYQSGFGAPAPDFHTVAFGDIEALERAFDGAPGYFAAFVVEPIQGEGGIVEAPPGYLLRAQEAARRAGALFVVDEIQTGLGRTGALFASESEGLAPDVLTVAKALGGGLVPIGATLCRREVLSEAFATRHSSTFAGNTIACRVGIAVMDRLERDDRALIASVADNGARLKQGLVEIAARYPEIVRSVRGRGYLLGIELGVDRFTWPDSLLGYVAEQGLLAPLVASHLLNVEGVRTAPTLNGGDVLRIEPPLVAGWRECERFLAALDRTLAALAEGDTAGFVGHLVGFEERAPGRPATSPPFDSERRARRRERSRSEEDGSFAFLMHPLDVSSYCEFDPSLRRLDPEQLATLQRKLMSALEPMPVGEAVIETESGRRAVGEFIVVPYDAEELMRRPPKETLAAIESAARLAGERGARIVGLGGFLSVASLGGLHLRNRGLPALTTGNSYTVVAAEQAIREAAAARLLAPERATLAVVGASGAIGRAASMRLAGEFERLVLVGNPSHAERSRRRLFEVASDFLYHVWRLERTGEPAPGSIASRLAELRPSLPRDASRAALMERVRRSGVLERALVITTELESWLPLAEIVVTATSSTERLVGPEHLATDAIVCDLSRPSNVSEAVKLDRPDVHLFAGGVVRTPRASVLDCRFGLPPGHVYACMAETMLLALERRYENTSVGLNLDLDTIAELQALSAKHGFEPHVAETETETETAPPRLARAV